jgi:hypothetical protein
MAHDASELLGSPQKAGVTVASVGYARAQALRVNGFSGPPIGRMLGATLTDPNGEVAQTPRFGAGFVAVTGTELALLSLRTTSTRLVLGEVVDRVALEEVTSASLHGRFPVALLTIGFHNGDSWEVEVAAVHKRAAKKVVAVLAPD